MTLIGFCLLIGVAVAPKKKSSKVVGTCDDWLSGQISELDVLTGEFTAEASSIFGASFDLRLTANVNGVIGRVNRKKPWEVMGSGIEGFQQLAYPVNMKELVKKVANGKGLADESRKIGIDGFCKKMRKFCSFSSNESVSQGFIELERMCASWSDVIVGLKAAYDRADEALEQAAEKNPVSKEKSNTLNVARMAYESEIFRSVVKANLFVANVKRLSEAVSGKALQKIEESPADLKSEREIDDELKSFWDQLKSIRSELGEKRDCSSKTELALQRRAVDLALRVSSMISIGGFTHMVIKAFSNQIALKRNTNILFMLIEQAYATGATWHAEYESRISPQTSAAASESITRVITSFSALMKEFTETNTDAAIHAIDRSEALRKQELAAGFLMVNPEHVVPVGDEPVACNNDILTEFHFFENFTNKFLSAREGLHGFIELFCQELKGVPSLGAVDDMTSKVGFYCDSWLAADKSIRAQSLLIKEELSKLTFSMKVDSDVVAHIHSLRLDFERMLINEVLRPVLFSMRVNDFFLKYANAGRNGEVHAAVDSPISQKEISRVRETLEDSLKMLEALSVEPRSKGNKLKYTSVAKKALKSVLIIAEHYQIGDIDREYFAILLADSNPNGLIISSDVRFSIRFIEMCLEAIETDTQPFKFSVPMDSEGGVDELEVWNSLSPAFISEEIRSSLEKLKTHHDSLMSGPAELTDERAENDDLIRGRYRNRATRLRQLLKYSNRRFQFNLPSLSKHDIGSDRFETLREITQRFLDSFDALELTDPQAQTQTDPEADTQADTEADPQEDFSHLDSLD